MARRRRTQKGAGHPHVARGATRQAVAAEAARLLATGDETTMGAAKRRAASMLGADRRGDQPGNLEIQAALAEHQRLFEPEALEARLDFLRREAVNAMIYLEAFRPRLVGPVLYGTACDYTPVTLHVFTDEPEAVMRRLMELGVRIDTDERDVRYPDGSQRTRIVYQFERGEAAFDLVVMPEIETRNPPASGIDGRPAVRATLAEVKSLIESAATSTA